MRAYFSAHNAADSAAGACGISASGSAVRLSSSAAKRGMQYMELVAREELSEDPGLLRTPIVRGDGGVAVQPGPDEMKRVVGK